MINMMIYLLNMVIVRFATLTNHMVYDDLLTFY